MTGTLINVVAIAAGGIIGIIIKKGLPEKIEKNLLKIVGFCTAIIGLNGVLTTMFSVDLHTGKISSSGDLILLISLVVGVIIGEMIDIDKYLNQGGKYIEEKVGAEGFAKGFINASLLFVIGAMGIIGAINDGLTGDSSVLIVKSVIDFIMSIILGSALGIGVMFAGIPVLLYQGGISLAAGFFSTYLQGELLDMILMAGYSMVIFIGLNFLFNINIKTANLLPAFLVPVFYTIFQNLIF